jgi:Leucine-rich repeat (LRR) protein
MKMHSSTFILLFFSSLFFSLASSICPKKCSCDDDDMSVSCNGNLTVVPIFLNPEVRRLNLSGNAIRALEGALTWYVNLEVLDLSGNMFMHVGKRQFATQAELQTLNLSNNFLTALRDNSFVGPAALLTLDLSRNALEVVNDDTFVGLDSLVELRLRHNKIREITPSAFAGLRRLRVLHLENNLLSALGPDWMAPMGNLRFLYASSNGVTALPDDAFKALTALRVVQLSRNRLSDVGQFAFRGSRAVDTLDLSHNLLSKVPTVPLSQMPQLSHLDLSGNPIRSLDRTSFHMMFVLETLRLNEMELLETIGQHAFVDNLKMRELSLEANRALRPLPWGMFDTNALLERVSFRDNAWETLSPNQIPQRSLRDLSISGLPLHCNCSIIWLWELYQRRNTSGVILDQVDCSSVEADAPEGSTLGGGSGDPLSQMAPDQLICTSKTGHILIVVSIAVLVTVLVLVIVAVIWYKVREWRFRRKYFDSGMVPSGVCLHIKDDTMVYKEAMPPGGTMRSPTHSSATYRPTYAAYSPPPGPPPPSGQYMKQDEDEPFYEVPKYGCVTTGVGGASAAAGGDDPKSSSGSSKYSSSTTSGFVGSELWDQDYFQHHHQQPQTHQLIHVAVAPGTASGYANFTSPIPGRMFYHGSPQSTSTVTTTGGGSLSSGSSSSGSGGRQQQQQQQQPNGTAVFYSPSRTGVGAGNKYPSGTFHHHHPGLSPMMHSEFGQNRRHFTSARGKQQQQYQRGGGGPADGVQMDLFV